VRPNGAIFFVKQQQPRLKLVPGETAMLKKGCCPRELRLIFKGKTQPLSSEITCHIGKTPAFFRQTAKNSDIFPILATQALFSTALQSVIIQTYLP